VRKVFTVTATMAVGFALLSCAPRPRVVYAPPSPVIYAPSLSPADYRHQPFPPAYARRRAVSFGASTFVEPGVRPQAGSHFARRTSPSRAAVKKKTHTSATSTAKPDPLAKFKAAQAKAAKVGVENLTKEDIEGLTSAQITELRGY
jgi:hypothetical protein